MLEPDKAYVVIIYLQQESINFIKKGNSVANSPETDGIKKFLSVSKGHAYANVWKT